MSIIKRGLIWVIIAAHLCACAPVVPVDSFVSEAQRGQMGSVGVVALVSAPQSDFVGPRGRGAGAAQGAGEAASGAIKGVGDPMMSPEARILYIILLPVIVPVAAIGGAVSGGAQAVPGDNAGEIEVRLRAILAEADPQGKLRSSVIDAATQAGVHGVTEITANIPTVAGQGVDYRQLPAPKVDTILEVGLVFVSFFSHGGADAIKLHVGAFARLVNARTNAELYRHTFRYNTEPKKFSEWNADWARLIKEETENAYRSLGQSIVDEIFLVVRTN